MQPIANNVRGRACAARRRDEGCQRCLLDLVGRANEIMHDVSALALAAVADAIENFAPGRIVEANDHMRADDEQGHDAEIGHADFFVYPAQQNCVVEVVFHLEIADLDLRDPLPGPCRETAAPPGNRSSWPTRSSRLFGLCSAAAAACDAIQTDTSAMRRARIERSFLREIAAHPPLPADEHGRRAERHDLVGLAPQQQPRQASPAV